jgi:hypothetical protein
MGNKHNVDNRNIRSTTGLVAALFKSRPVYKSVSFANLAKWKAKARAQGHAITYDRTTGQWTATVSKADPYKMGVYMTRTYSDEMWNKLKHDFNLTGENRPSGWMRDTSQPVT